jgi:acetyl esterase/lipase
VSQAKQTHTYRIASQCQIQADVYGADDNARRPVIVWIHGGALILGHRAHIPAFWVDTYVEAAYTVVSIDYRLAPEAKLPAIAEDLCDAIGWVRNKGHELFGIDPERLAVVGHSAGGYLTLMSGFCVSPPPRALVSFYGYGDITGAWYSRPDPFYCQQPPVGRDEAYAAVTGPVLTGCESGEARGRFYLYCRQQGLWPLEVAGHDPHTEPVAFEPFCPIRNVSPGYPPTLLLHGDQDTDVPYEQSVMMADALGRAGVEHELVTIPGGGHGFDMAEGARADPAVAAACERVLAFLREHTK